METINTVITAVSNHYLPGFNLRILYAGLPGNALNPRMYAETL